MKKFEPQALGRVISSRTAKQLTEILIGVVENGTGKTARLKTYRVAGKTGTAQKSKPLVGYEKGEYIASFIGFLPAEDPQLLIGVFIDEPREGLHWGGYIAAPLFRKIAQRVLCLDSYNNKILNESIAGKLQT